MLTLGCLVEIAKSHEVGRLVKWSATEAVVRTHHGDVRVHPRLLVRLPTQAEIAAETRRIKAAVGLTDDPDLE